MTPRSLPVPPAFRARRFQRIPGHAKSICFAVLAAIFAYIPAIGFGQSASTPSYVAPGYVVEGHASLGWIHGRGQIEYDAPIAETRTFRFSFQLIDDADAPVFIEKIGFVQKNIPTVTEEIEVALVKGINPITVDVDLVPTQRLDGSKQYRVRLLQVEDITDPFPVVVPGMNATQLVGNPYLHFPDGSGVIARMAGATFQKRFRVQSGAGDQGVFKIEPRVDFYRYQPGQPDLFHEVELTCEMFDDLDNPIPLSQSVFLVTSATAITATNGPTTPQAKENSPISGQTLNLIPQVQLDSPGRSYHVEVNLRFVNHPLATFVTSQNGKVTPATGLLDFNGTIAFGDIDGEFTTIVNAPAFGAVAAGRVSTGLAIPEGNGQISGGGGDYAFGTGLTWDVGLDAAGVAHFSSGEPATPVAAPDVDNSSVAGVVIERSDLTLDSNGLTAGSLRVNLPGGIGFASGGDTLYFDGFAELEDIALGQNLVPVDASIQVAGAGKLHEETKPFYYTINSLSWTTATGTFLATSNNTVALRKTDLLQLESEIPNLENPAAGIKASNDHVFNGVGAVNGGFFSISVDASGNGQVSSIISMLANEFYPHLPYASQDGISDPIVSVGGTLSLFNDRPAAGSKLTGVNAFTVEYDRACIEASGGEPGCGAQSDLEEIVFVPSAQELNFTPDGGLQAGSGLFLHKLQWGADPIVPGKYTHIISTSFTSGSYLMAGSYLAGGIQGTGTLSGNPAQWMGVGAILFSGVDPSGGPVVRPDTAAYAETDTTIADYPGINLRVANHGGTMEAKSRITGIDTPNYPLASRSQYYVRRGGVSGIHQASVFDEALVLYGYDVALSSFQFNYLGNINHESRTNGSIDIPEPSDFTVDFAGLKISCPGALLSAEVDSAKSLLLSYWADAPINPLALRFETSNGCDPSAPACLVLGVDARAELFEEKLVGELGFRPSGQIATMTNAIDGQPEFASRLKIPSLMLPGPGSKKYVFTPVQDAYFNDESLSGGANPGFLNLFGTVNAPFFQDMKWHVQTRARPPVEGVPPLVYQVAGGWSDGGATAFGSALFDAAHRGFPVAAGGVENYRNSSRDGGTYAVLAKQDWLGIENAFHYNLRWNQSGRVFNSESVDKDFFVFNLTHRAKYLSPDTAEITFGAEYDGLPKINLAGMAADALDVGVGYTGSLVDALGQQVAGSLLDGVDSAKQLVAPTLDALIDPFIYGDLANAVDAMLDEIYDVPVAMADDEEVLAVEDVVEREVPPDAVDRYIEKGGPIGLVFDNLLRLKKKETEQPQASIYQTFDEVGVLSEDPLTLLDLVDSRIVTVQIALGAFTLDEDGVFQTSGVKKLIRSIVADQAPEFIGLIAAEIGGNVVEEPLTELLNAPGLAEIRESLESVHGLLGEARQGLQDEANGLMAQIATPSEDEIPIILETMRQALMAEMNRYAVGGMIPLHEIPREQLREVALRTAKEALLGGQIMQTVQVQLREYLQDSLSAVTNEIDSGFQIINGSVRDIIATALASVDEGINQELLGPMNDLIGAGKLNGYARINGNSLTELRVDGSFRWKVPDDLDFSGYLLIKQLNSDNRGGCIPPGMTANEITIGANRVPLDWISSGLRANVSTKFTIFEGAPVGMGGSFEMTGGPLTFEAFKINELKAAVAFGSFGGSPALAENYLAAGVSMDFGEYGMSGGAFFGRTCTLDPIMLIDPEVAAVLGTPPFTGVYLYGEARIPVNELIGIPSSCLLMVKIGAGAGVFVFAEGPTYGGKMVGEVTGEALCLISINGRMSMIGLKQGTSASSPMRFNGNGRLKGKIGACPFCKRFNKSVGISFNVTKGKISSPSLKY